MCICCYSRKFKLPNSILKSEIEKVKGRITDILSIDCCESLFPKGKSKISICLKKASCSLGGEMKIRYTRHALHMIKERSIDLSWVVQTLKSPTEMIDDPAMAGARRYFGRIAEQDGRWLRVVPLTRATKFG